MLDPVIVPPSNQIEQWSDLNDLPIVETVPRSVPLTVYVKYPCEGVYERIVSMKAALPASTDVATIRDLAAYIRMVDDYLSHFYSCRAISPPLLEYIEKIKQSQNTNVTPAQFQTEDAKQLARSYVVPQLDFLKQEKTDCCAIINALQQLFLKTIPGRKDESIWENGFYSDQLLDHICFLLFKMQALEILAPSKTAIVNDISNFMKIANDEQLSIEAQTIRIWIANVHAITFELLDKLCQMRPALTIAIFNIFESYIRAQIEADSFVFPDIQYAYINAYIFFINFYEHNREAELKSLKSVKKPKPVLKELSDDIKLFTKELIANFPLMEYIYELATLTSDCLLYKDMLKLSKKENITRRPQFKTRDLDEMLTSSKENFTNLSHLLSNIQTVNTLSVSAGRKLAKQIPQILHHIAISINKIREEMAQVLAKPPQAPASDTRNLLPYERSMLYGLTSKLNVILLTLSQSRTMKELIQTNLPLINEYITNYIQYTIQDFVKNTLAVAIARNSDYKKSLGVIFTTLRTLLGYFKTTDELNVKETNPKKIPHIDIKSPQCPPNLALLELMRSQLQYLVNPNSEYVVKKGALSGTILNKLDQDAINEFLEESKHWSALLQLSDTLDTVCDQSVLFFKEYHLELNKVTFFRVTTSLPIILSDYALKNYQKPELTGSIFYPLSIYDDAASTALRYLKSRHLYEEIKAEAYICLESITQLISDSAFHPIRKFCSIHYFPQSMIQDVTQRLGNLQENVSALRLGVILQQNQLYLLGCHINSKALIAERVNKILDDEITKIFRLTDRHGVLAMIPVHCLVDILRATHKLLIGFGLPLIPFEDLVARVISTDTPNSLQSLLLVNVASHMSESIIPRYYLKTNPYRLIPKDPVAVELGTLYVGNDIIGPVIQEIFAPLASFVTVENFRELFWYLDDGAISMLAQQMTDEIPDIFATFTQTYSQVASRIRLIKNVPMDLSCHQTFDRYEGAYRYFLDDGDVHRLLEQMSQLGNIIALSKLMDDAFALKKGASEQISSFLLSRNPTSDAQATTPQLFDLFDKEFQKTSSWFQTMYAPAKENEIISPFVFNAYTVFINELNKNLDLFNETSPNILDIQSCNGFAAVWSVLAFLFCLLETTNTDDAQKNAGSFVAFGEGVFVCAASIILGTGQRTLMRTLSIGEKIVAHSECDFAASDEPRVKKFLTINQLINTNVMCAITDFQPTIERVCQK